MYVNFFSDKSTQLKQACGDSLADVDYDLGYVEPINHSNSQIDDCFFLACLNTNAPRSFLFRRILSTSDCKTIIFLSQIYLLFTIIDTLRKDEFQTFEG